LVAAPVSDHPRSLDNPGRFPRRKKADLTGFGGGQQVMPSDGGEPFAKNDDARGHAQEARD
jgi:hypothetical protein